MNPLLRLWRHLVELIPPLNWQSDIVAAWQGETGIQSGWTVLLGMLVAVACGLIGCYLIVQRLSLIGDAISHTVFPGIVIAFLLTGQIAGPVMFVGAAAAGVFTTAAISFLHRTSRLKEDAAVGIVFTTLFALGVVLLSLFARDAHLDVQHVLLGQMEFALLQKVTVAGREIPVAVLQMAGVVISLMLLIAFFYKELLAAAFDQQWSAAVGLRPRLFHYGLMTVLSLTVVGAFTSVGAILVVAMLIAPPATACLLSDRLKTMFLIAGISGAIASLVGFQIAYWLNVSTGGAMVCTECGLFGLAFLFGPQRGLVAVRVRRTRIRWRTTAENVVRDMFKRGQATPDGAVNVDQMGTDLQISRAWLPLVLGLVRRRGWIEPISGRAGYVRLTASGTLEAQRLDRAHRLLETYLVNRVGIASDHVHPTAEDLEHLVGEPLLERIDDALGHPDVDPHGTPIPRSPVSDQRPGVFTLSKLRVGDRGRIVGIGETLAMPQTTPSTAPVVSVVPLHLPLGEWFTVIARDAAPPLWKITLANGRELRISHAQADAVLVELESQ